MQHRNSRYCALPHSAISDGLVRREFSYSPVLCQKARQAELVGGGVNLCVRAVGENRRDVVDCGGALGGALQAAPGTRSAVVAPVWLTIAATVASGVQTTGIGTSSSPEVSVAPRYH